MNNIKKNTNNNLKNLNNEKVSVLNMIVTSAIVTTIGSVFAVGVNKHMTRWTEDCKKNNKAHFFCKTYLSETGQNIILIVLTFITTIIFGLLIYYFFNIII